MDVEVGVWRWEGVDVEVGVWRWEGVDVEVGVWRWEGVGRMCESVGEGRKVWRWEGYVGYGICHIRASNIFRKTHKSAKEGVDTHFK